MKNSKVVMEIVIIISLLFALSTVVLADNTQIIIGGGSTNTQNDTATNIPNVVMNTTTNTNVNTPDHLPDETSVAGRLVSLSAQSQHLTDYLRHSDFLRVNSM